MEVKRVSKGLFLGGYIACTILAMIIFLIAYGSIFAGIMISEESGNDTTGGAVAAAGGIFVFIAVLLYLAATVILFVLYYKMWAAIQDGDVRTTPGKAVGFLLIPFFNLYWLFQAIWGWSQDYNKYIEAKSIQTKKMPEGLFLATCIVIVCSCIPCLNYLTGFAAPIMLIIVMNFICNGINALADATPSVPGENPEQPAE